MTPRRVRVKVGDRWYTVEVRDTSVSPIEVVVDGETFLVETDSSEPVQPKPLSPSPSVSEGPGGRASSAVLSDNIVRSPMPGRVLTVSVQAGDHVSAGDEICVVEAMKMHQSICVSRGGRVVRVYIAPDQQVNTDDPLVELG